MLNLYHEVSWVKWAERGKGIENIGKNITESKLHKECDKGRGIRGLEKSGGLHDLEVPMGLQKAH